MPTFEHSFSVDAPIEAVRAFHADTSALKALSPPGTFAQMHSIEPLAEGSVSEFTLWMGPLPVRWRAVHRDVGPDAFTDVQDRGPAASWSHTHRFVDLGDGHTRVDDRIVFEHKAGIRGLVTRVLFCRPALRALFAWRAHATRAASSVHPRRD